MPRQDSQRNGRKSSWRQYSYWQLRPMDSRSASAICVKLVGWGEDDMMDSKMTSASGGDINTSGAE